MDNKRMIVSMVASGVIASGFFAVDKASAATHTVEEGDTLWAISQKYNVSVAELMKVNHLSSSIIFPKQTLETTSGKPIKSKVTKKEQTTTTTYTVKSGDTLGGIAVRYGTSVAALKKINNLSSDLIFPKQVLNIGNAKAKENSNNKKEKINKDYTVRSGDTLSGIAQKFNVSVTQLKKINNLSNDLIFPNQVLNIAKGAGTPSNSAAQAAIPVANKSTNKSTYVVKAGDTLSGIALRYGITYKDLMKWNGLDTTIILPGDKLVVANGKPVNTSTPNQSAAPAQSSQSDSAGYDIDKLVNIANSLQGTVYLWGGATPSGFDCSGFIHFVYNKAGKSMGRLSSTGYFDKSYYVRSPQVGDLVFFENTYRAGISHLGIYLGNDQFISAESSGVKVNHLNDPYWSKKFHGIKRLF